MGPTRRFVSASLRGRSATREVSAAQTESGGYHVSSLRGGIVDRACETPARQAVGSMRRPELSDEVWSLDRR
jgi:hypothetical protein